MSKRELTPKRRQILEAMQGRIDHPTAEELYCALRDRGSRTSLATVYRALRSLAEDGLLREVRGLGPDRFDPIQKSHYHLVCTRCSGIHDAEIPYQNSLDTLPSRSGFRASGHEITFFGICAACSNHKEEHDGQSR